MHELITQSCHIQNPCFIAVDHDLPTTAGFQQDGPAAAFIGDLATTSSLGSHQMTNLASDKPAWVMYESSRFFLWL